MITVKQFVMLALAIFGSLAAEPTNEDLRSERHVRFSRIKKNRLEDRQTCSGPKNSNPTRYWLDAQNHTGAARGYAPFIDERGTYPVYRNVRSYGALGDGNKDDTAALQKAINTISAGPDLNSPGTRYANEVTTRPALVFVPGGTYKLTGTLDLRLNTIMVGDPLNPPIFKASSNFNGDSLINGNDFVTANAAGTTNFFVAVKNIIIDTTTINKDASVIALRWGVAQACQLTNIKIQMPTNSAGHVGIDLNQGSAISVTDIVSLCPKIKHDPLVLIILTYVRTGHRRRRSWNPQ